MFRFLKAFISAWCDYPRYKKYCEWLKVKYPHTFFEIEQKDRERGIKPYTSRFNFAYRHANRRG